MTTQAEADFIARLDDDAKPLTANQIADRYQAFRSRDEVLTALHERLSDAAHRGVTGRELDAVVHTLRDDFNGFLAGYRGEQRAALNRFPPGHPTPWRLGRMHLDLDTLAAAAGHSPASVYRDAPDSAQTDLSEAGRTVVAAITGSAMSVQPLKILDDPRGYGPLGSRSVEGDPPVAGGRDTQRNLNIRDVDREAKFLTATENWTDEEVEQTMGTDYARSRRARRTLADTRTEGRRILRAVSLAAHYSGHRVLAIPATAEARNEAQTRRYAHHVAADPLAAIAKMATGEWKPPPGSLLIIDDADELGAEELRQLSTLAAATNAKLLLVTADHAGMGPADRSRRSRQVRDRPTRDRTDVMTHSLPWGQCLGTHDDVARAAAAADNFREVEEYLAGLSVGRPSGRETPDDIAHQEANDLLTRHAALADNYRVLTAPLLSRATGRDGPSRDCGIAL
jgi:hypothetical protein